jgi:cell division protein FtsI/penicillin-binding protein 2
MEPHVVKSITDSKGKVVEIKPKQVRRVLGREAAEVMTEIMVGAVDNGEAKWAKPKGYRIAGKTGTAQIPVAGHYDATKTIASFVGFGPADDPQFVMLVTLREPTSSPWGSETAAPLFFNIARDIFMYKNILPK